MRPGVAGEAGIDGCGFGSKEHGHIGRVAGWSSLRK